MHHCRRTVLPGIAFLLLAQIGYAETATIAVASNFGETARALVVEFEARTSHDVRLVPGSSGKLFAQIVNGAPYDVFLSADVERPARLESRSLTERRVTYALGELAIWSRVAASVEGDCVGALLAAEGVKIAIANPRHAPYGIAARSWLQARGAWTRLQAQLVYGENVAQTLQFAATGSAAFAVVSRSQTGNPQLPDAGCSSTIPTDEYAPIEQQAVLLLRAKDNPAALAFMRFLVSDEARQLIVQSGYRVPDERS